jgi:hypothetical protein
VIAPKTARSFREQRVQAARLLKLAQRAGERPPYGLRKGICGGDRASIGAAARMPYRIIPDIVRFAAHYGLKLDIALGPISAVIISAFENYEIQVRPPAARAVYIAERQFMLDVGPIHSLATTHQRRYHPGNADLAQAADHHR